jgi:hypothetical protein
MASGQPENPDIPPEISPGPRPLPELMIGHDKSTWSPITDIPLMDTGLWHGSEESLNRPFQGTDTGLGVIDSIQQKPEIIETRLDWIPFDESRLAGLTVAPAIKIPLAPLPPAVLAPLPSVVVPYKGEMVEIAVMPQGDIMPIISATNTPIIKQEIMQGQIDTLKAVWTDAAKSFIPSVGRQITAKQYYSGDVKEGDTMVVTPQQIGLDNPYFWYNPVQNANMVYSGGSWFLNMPYDSGSSTPALEFTAREWIYKQSPTYAQEMAEKLRISTAYANQFLG